MPFALLILGVILIVAAIRGTQDDLFTLMKSDFTGSGNFFYWVIAIAVLVALGNVKELRPISNAFLTLVIIVIIIADGKEGLFESFIDQVKSGTSGGSNHGGLFGALPSITSSGGLNNALSGGANLLSKSVKDLAIQEAATAAL